MPLRQTEKDPNHLLDALKEETRVQIAPYIECLDIELGTVVCEASSSLRHVYFPLGSVLSLLTVLENGSTIETATIGREGAFGLYEAMYGRTSFNRCLVQMSGAMAKCPVDIFRHHFESDGNMRDVFISYTETLLSQVQQTVACNAMHTTEQRICRWLLTVQDRTGSVLLPYTHEFLANILGANRKSVTLAAQSMQNAGLIKYSRGMIQILDRDGLEAASCECYSVVKERLESFQC